MPRSAPPLVVLLVLAVALSCTTAVNVGILQGSIPVFTMLGAVLLSLFTLLGVWQSTRPPTDAEPT